MLKLYNTLTRKKEEFQPLKKGKVGLYVCGPTVYWFAHVGNFRTYLFADVLCRALEMNDYSLTTVVNITDVGHLTDDEDQGEDKMLVAMRREGKTAFEIAEFYTQAFMKDVEQLNIKPAQEFPKATDHIQEQINMIKLIEKNGFAYTTSDGVYFDTSKLPEYGVLSGQKAEDKKAGARVEMKEKKNPTDFALWKFSPKDQQRDMEWESSWGKGFPGWHIECSAMAEKYLGPTFDIHTGGVDHIAVHHENEIAQAVGANHAQQARFWMHGEYLTVDNGKMSKSLGNLYTIDDLVEKGIDPLSFRYFVLGAHYRTKLNFTWEALEAAQNALFRLRDIVRDWEAPKDECDKCGKRFKDAINDDLNTPQALAIVWELVDSDKPSHTKAQTLLKFDEVLGLGLKEYIAKPLLIPDEISALLVEREKVRKEKDWKASDEIREQIKTKGFLVEDTDQGQKLREKR